MTFTICEVIASEETKKKGVISFDYPDGTDEKSLTKTGHEVWVDKFQSLLKEPVVKFTFTKKNISLKYNGETPIPLGARLGCQLTLEVED